MKLLIVGATGKTGQNLLAQLKRTTHSVWGFIRNIEQAPLVTQYDASPLLGDLNADIDLTSEGFDAILFVAGSRGKDVAAIDHMGLVRMVNAAVSAKITRFIYIGSINVGKEPSQFIRELNQFYKDNNDAVPERLSSTIQSPRYHHYIKMKEKAEAHIVSSCIHYTILRAGLLTQEEGSGSIAVTDGTLDAFGQISRENVAAAFIETLENACTYQKIYTILDGNTQITKAFV